MVNLGNGDYAIIHLEDGKGSYQDMFYPSYRIISKKGKSIVLDRLIKGAEYAKPSLDYVLKRRKKALGA